MTEARELDEQRLEYELRGLNAWNATERTLVREFAFGDRPEAMRFVRAASEVVGDHESSIDFFSRFAQVRVAISTEGAERVTMGDIELAHRIDALAGKR